MSRSSSQANVDKEVLTAAVTDLAVDLKKAIDLTNEHARSLANHSLEFQKLTEKTISDAHSRSTLSTLVGWY